MSSSNANLPGSPGPPIREKPNAGLPQKLTFGERLNYVSEKKVKKTRRPKLRGKDLYPMVAAIRGFCVIVANYKFKYLDSLLGYSRDIVYLKRVWQELHFEVIVLKNLTGKQILEKFDYYSKLSPLSDGTLSRQVKPNAFIGIILSHGYKNKIFGVDHNPKNPKEEEDMITVEQESRTGISLTTILNNRNSPLLKDVPKLVFIQACRGDNEDDGVFNSDSRRSSSCVPAFVTIERSIETARPSLVTDTMINEEVNEGQTQLILQSDTSPTITELLICYSTLNGYRSYVFNSGSVFGVALAETLINFAHNMDIVRMLSNKLSKAVCEEEIAISKPITRAQSKAIEYEQKNQKQVVNIHLIGFHNQLYLNPGYTSSNDRKNSSKDQPPSLVPTPSTSASFSAPIQQQPSIQKGEKRTRLRVRAQPKPKKVEVSKDHRTTSLPPTPNTSAMTSTSTEHSVPKEVTLRSTCVQSKTPNRIQKKKSRRKFPEDKKQLKITQFCRKRYSSPLSELNVIIAPDTQNNDSIETNARTTMSTIRSKSGTLAENFSKPPPPKIAKLDKQIHHVQSNVFKKQHTQRVSSNICDYSCILDVACG